MTYAGFVVARQRMLESWCRLILDEMPPAELWQEMAATACAMRQILELYETRSEAHHGCGPDVGSVEAAKLNRSAPEEATTGNGQPVNRTLGAEWQEVCP
jgi:carbamate kinase